jgi:glycosyltransferase involved in cell wall biosynthesis
MRVAINAIPLVGPMTGIGNYTWHLAREMASLLPEAPWLFYGREWSRELRLPPAPVAAAARRKLGMVLPLAHHAARWWQQRHFTPGARARGVELYHEPNYLAYRFDGPMVVTVHDLSWIRYPQLHPPDRVRTMNDVMPGVVERARHVIVDSEFVRAEVLSHFGVDPARVTATPLGVSSDFAPRAAAQTREALDALGLRHGEYFLAVGTLEPRKNLASVVGAFSRLSPAARRACPLVIAGMSGWGRDRVPAMLAGMLDAGEARMLGYVEQAQLPSLYSGSRLFLYPSLYEGFGLPPLEAMACGAAVVASNAASLPEVIGDAGLLVEALDEPAITRAMERSLQDEAWRDGLGHLGRQRAAGFTWQRCAEQTLDIYRKVLHRP